MDEIQEMEERLSDLEERYSEMEEDWKNLEEDDWLAKYNPDNGPDPMGKLEDEIFELKKEIEDAYEETIDYSGLDPAFRSWEEFYRMVL